MANYTHKTAPTQFVEANSETGGEMFQGEIQ
jgi:hypothetical protein